MIKTSANLPHHFNTHISELDEANLPDLRDTVVGRLAGEEQLAQGHVLTPEYGAHGGLMPPWAASLCLGRN